MGKKILIVVQNCSVPKDSRVWNEARALAKHGYKVTVLSLLEDNETWFEIIDNVRIYRCPVPTSIPGMIGYALEYTWSIIVFTLYIIVLHILNRFSAIQACNPPDFFFHVGWFCKLTGTRFVYDQHDLCPELFLTKFPGEKGLIYRGAVWIEGATHSTADAVICTNTSYAKLAMERHEVPVEKLWIVRNGPNLDVYDNIEPNADLKGSFKYMVVYGGKIAEQDGADILVQVANRIIKELDRKDILFVVLGDGPALNSVKRMAADLEINKWIHFGGWVDRKVLIQYMKSADVCMSPEPSSPLNDKSTFVKVIEYVASGKPIVAFALQETMVTAGDAAIYAEIDSINEMASNLIEVLDSPQRQIAMQQAALERRRMLSWAISEKVYLSAFDGLLLEPEEFDDLYEQHGWDLLSMPRVEAMNTTEEIRS